MKYILDCTSFIKRNFKNYSHTDLHISLLRLLAKIKCSISSYQFKLTYTVILTVPQTEREMRWKKNGSVEIRDKGGLF